eukprot:2126087-Pyramimonas_sp.AAC.1
MGGDTVSQRPPKARAGRLQLARSRKQRVLAAAADFVEGFALSPHPDKLPAKEELANPKKRSNVVV